MKILLNAFLILITFLIYGNKVFALTDYQIREICKNKSRRSSCIKNLQYKRYNLLKGNRIEIPVIPFKR
tara:strand:- start:53 stop:259 length:207 start_codon:yes stop_codon:yes gene_type:complete